MASTSIEVPRLRQLLERLANHPSVGPGPVLTELVRVSERYMRASSGPAKVVGILIWKLASDLHEMTDTPDGPLDWPKISGALLAAREWLGREDPSDALPALGKIASAF